MGRKAGKVTAQDIQQMRALAKTMTFKQIAKKTGWSVSTVAQHCRGYRPKGYKRVKRPKNLKCPKCGETQNIQSAGLSWLCMKCGRAWYKKYRQRPQLKLSPADTQLLADVINKGATILPRVKVGNTFIQQIQIQSSNTVLMQQLAQIIGKKIYSKKGAPTKILIIAAIPDLKEVAMKTLPFLLGRQKMRMQNLLNSLPP